MTTKQLIEPSWPALDFADWHDTLVTLHLWTQIVGKIRLRQMPWTNHSWHVPLYVASQGFTTGSLPYEGGVFQIDFNFLAHQLRLSTSNGEVATIRLYARSVANFHQELMDQLNQLGIDVSIHPVPNEVEQAIPFAEDEIHHSYDPVMVSQFWQAVVRIHTVFTRFRAGFTGKCSPVHFFWGSFDLAVTRFSGRPAPLHPGGAPNMSDRVMQEAYSHEVSSAGFWPGSEQFPQAAFYSYCYPTPENFGQQPVKPAEAFFSPEMGEFFLPYDAVRRAADPEQMLLDFLRTTYEAAAKTGQWNRNALECDFSSFEM
ncbi:DUF5996 family protein [Spirosoma pollinicola]|uniref:Ava_C0101 and related proteins n=1 Tax=Spirosoma pollinicola TaxID=2057025 RepID=A0A2K8Z176_9BACT|nr:DUF5996 family protein [Spirosoma pollinicola]AUD03611.1 hypothetical protein CWM47_18330 [Spirosoma pollinicola]